MFFFWALKASHSVFGLETSDPSHYGQVCKSVYMYVCRFHFNVACCNVQRLTKL